MIRIALVIVGAFACLHLAGARADVGLLSGTTPGSEAELFAGLVYTAAWFGAILLAPILVLSATFAKLLRSLAGRYGRMKSSGETWIDSRQP